MRARQSRLAVPRGAARRARARSPCAVCVQVAHRIARNVVDTRAALAPAHEASSWAVLTPGHNLAGAHCRRGVDSPRTRHRLAADLLHALAVVVRDVAQARSRREALARTYGRHAGRERHVAVARHTRAAFSRAFRSVLRLPRPRCEPQAAPDNPSPSPPLWTSSAAVRTRPPGPVANSPTMSPRLFKRIPTMEVPPRPRTLHTGQRYYIHRRDNIRPLCATFSYNLHTDGRDCAAESH